jgi:large subunit ribosomal protein L4
MPELDLVNLENKKIGTVTMAPEIFDAKVYADLVQKYITMQLAARRRGTASTISNKGDLHGSNKKPWRQKGTGRARAGNTRSPIWRGGLTAFGPTPRDFSFKMSKKTKKLALTSTLTDRFQNNGIAVVDKLTISSSKTKDAVEMLKKLGLPKKTLIIIAEKDANLQLAVRNLPESDVLLVDGLNAFDLLVHEKIVCSQDALKMIEERLN